MKLHSQRSAGLEPRTYTLAFPRDLTEDQVTAWVRSISGTMRSFLSGFGSSSAIGFELWADGDGLTYRLRVPSRHAEYILAQLRSLVPGIRVTPEANQPDTDWTRAVEIGIRGSQRPLRIFSIPDMAASLLASVQLLGRHEALLVQWVMTPALPGHPPQQQRAASRRDSRLEELLPANTQSRDAINERRRKLEEPNMFAVLRVAALASTDCRADQLLSRVRAALAAARGPSLHFVRRFVTDQALRTRIARAAGSVAYPIQLSAPEVTALIAWPVGSPHVAGLPGSRSRHLAPSGAIAREGLVIARSNFPGAERSLAVAMADTCKHLHVVGPTGTGKTVLLSNLAAQSMASGLGVVVLESKGDLFRAVLDVVPRRRFADVIVIDVSDSVCPVGFNILSEGNPRIVVEELCALFEYLYRDARSVWTREVLYHGLSTLVRTPGNSFVDLMPLLVPMNPDEEAWRDELIRGLSDRELCNFWQRFLSQPRAAQDRMAQPVMDRVWQLNARPEIRNIIGQSQSSFTMQGVVEQGKILLINLAGLGETTASLVGTLFINALWAAVKSASRRRQTHLYLDEFQDFLQLPIRPADMFVRARSFGLGITAAHQNLGQLPVDMREAILANARSKVVFQTTADDARAFAREFGRMVDDQDFMNLGNYEVLCKLVGSDGVSQPVTGLARPPCASTGRAAAIRANSQARYGRPLLEVENEISQRRRPTEAAAPKRPRLGGEAWG